MMTSGTSFSTSSTLLKVGCNSSFEPLLFLFEDVIDNIIGIKLIPKNYDTNYRFLKLSESLNYVIERETISAICQSPFISLMFDETTDIWIRCWHGWVAKSNQI